MSTRTIPLSATRPATLDDLAKVDGKAELINERTDYFLAGTLVVWDVDLISRCVRKYQADSQDKPIVFSQGEQVDAEPAVPGWRLTVDRLFS